jgi:hypothetical protein
VFILIEDIRGRVRPTKGDKVDDVVMEGAEDEDEDEERFWYGYKIDRLLERKGFISVD